MRNSSHSRLPRVHPASYRSELHIARFIARRSKIQGRVTPTLPPTSTPVHSSVFQIALLFLIFSLRDIAYAQERGLVFGTITDSVTNLKVPRVDIRRVRGGRETTSDLDGRFRMEVKQGEREVELVFNHVGYLERILTVHVKGRDSVRVDVVLVPRTFNMPEVTVVSDSQTLALVRSLGALALSPMKLANVAGSHGDIGKVLQTMPGVSANNETSGQFSVRGGAMMHNLFLINGAELQEPYHLKDAPNSGMTVLNTALVDRMLFLPGGFTARYGDRLSAVVELEQREGNRDRLAARFDASLSDAMAIVEGPVGENKSALLSLRSSYGDYITRYLTSGSERRPTFYDLSAGFALGPTSEAHYSISLLQSSDRTSGLSSGQYSTSLVVIRARHSATQYVTIRSTMSLSHQDEDMSRNAAVPEEGGVSWSKDSSNIVVAEGNVQADAELSEFYSLVLGLHVQKSAYDINRNQTLLENGIDSISSTGMINSMLKGSLYTENILRITPTIQMNAGLRFDYFSLTREAVLSPRLLLTFQASEHMMLNAAWGRYYQTPTFRQLLAATQVGEQPQRMQLAEHFVVGFVRNLDQVRRFRVEAYYKKLSQLISYDRLRTGDFIYSPRNDSRGEILGLEFEASFQDERAMGWLNVAWMKAKEVNNAPGSQWHRSPTDQSMTVNFVFEPKIAKGWVLSLRSMYGSGYAYVSDLPGTRGYVFNHYPDYKRVDLRLNYAFKTGPLQTTAFIEVTNLLSMKNVQSFKGTIHDPSTPDYNLLLPMIINVGMRYEY